MPNLHRLLRGTRQKGASFPNHELMILIAGVLLVLIVGIPALISGGGKGCLKAVVGVLMAVAILAALGGLLSLGGFLAEKLYGDDGSRWDRTWHAIGQVLRFLGGAALGLVIAAPVILPKGLSPRWEAGGLILGAALVGGLLVWTHGRVGPDLYRGLKWTFVGAIGTSWVLALLARLLPWPWAVDGALLGTPLAHLAFSAWLVASEPDPRRTRGEGPADPETPPTEGPEEPNPPGSGPGPSC